MPLKILSNVLDCGSTRAVPVSETFVSLQGEGALSGVPSWFCRLSGCNLRCRWCDTPYASWAPEGEPRRVEALVEEARGSGVRHAVLTGGEPMIFPQLDRLCGGLRDIGMHVTIETAGTVDRPGAACELLSVSPKLRNSTPADDPRDGDGSWAARHEARRLNLKTLGAMVRRTRAAGGGGGAGGAGLQMKFVVTGPGDLAEIEGVVSGLPGLRPDEIWLMPEGVTVPEPASVAWVVEACTARGWRYGARLHIALFGDARGT